MFKALTHNNSSKAALTHDNSSKVAFADKKIVLYLLEIIDPGPRGFDT